MPEGGASYFSRCGNHRRGVPFSSLFLSGMSHPYLSSHAGWRRIPFRDVARSAPSEGSLSVALDRYLRIVANSLDVPVVQVNVGTRMHQSLAWIGAPLERCRAEVSLDRVPRERRTLTVIQNVADVESWPDHPLASHPLNLCWYAGQPILPDASNTPARSASPPPSYSSTEPSVLAVMDVRPRELSAADRAVLADMSALIAEHLQPGEPLLDSIDEGFYVINGDWTFEYINKTAEEILGRPRESLIGQNLWEAFPDLIGTEAETFYRTPLDVGETGELTLFYEPLQIWVEARAYPWRDGIVVYFRDITDRTLNENQLRLFSRAIEETGESVIITDADVEAPGGPTIRYVNPAFEEMTGYGADEVIGSRPSVLQGPGTDRQVLDRIRAQIIDGHPVTDETVNYRKDGTPFIVEWNIAPVRDDEDDITHWVAVQRDMTETRQMEAEREKARHRVQSLHDIGRAILNASSAGDIAQATLERVGTLVEAERASVVDVNDAMEQATILALSGTSHSGLNVGDTVDLSTFRNIQGLHGFEYRVVRNLDHEATAPIEHRLLQIGIRSYVSVPLVASGDMIGILNIGSALPDGFPAPVVETVREVADMLAVALQQRRYREALVSAKERAEEMNQLKTAFLANMSHEVRTPLTSILGFADMISEQPESARDFAPFIQQGGERLLRTLSAVLDFAQLESNTYVFSPRQIDLCPIVRRVIALFQQEADQRGIDIRCDMPSDPVHLYADEQTVERIVTCVVENAIKFTSSGEVGIALSVHDGEAELRVTDTGVGISPGFLPHVFDEFRQESTGDGRTHEGNGLGLAITQKFVERAGGTIEADSVKGEGTTVTIRLPMSESDGKNPETHRKRAAAERAVHTSNKNSTSGGNAKRSSNPSISADHE